MKITTQNLGKRFNREWIFRNLECVFSAGNTYAITGPNGAGKSTLLQVLWGQMPQTTGSLEFTSNDGIPITMEECFRHLSIATPYMDLMEEFTLRELLHFHFKLRKSRYNLTVEEIIQRLYLENARDKHISNFSSGMKQRVKLGLAFFTEATMIFLDEPSTNLDKQAFEWYLKNLHELPADCLTLIASNDPKEYPEKALKINIQDYK